MLKKVLLLAIVVGLAAAVACGGDSKAPVSPTATAVNDADAGADGSTLKITAPTLQSPASGAVVNELNPNFVLANATSKYTPTSALGALEYEFVIETATGTVLATAKTGAGAALTGYRIAEGILQHDTNYRWRARAVQGSLVGPWAAYMTFKTFAKPVDPYLQPGWITPTEVWDPLTQGVTVGNAAGMEFIAGKGARTVGNDSSIMYALPATLSSGEMSMIVDNLNPLSAGDKTKLFSMAEGTGDITTNDYRFTIEKRGVIYPSPGQVRIRMITGDSGDHGRINDGGPWQPVLDKTKTYFCKVTWGNNRITLKIQEINPTTRELGNYALNVSSGYTFTYKPVPHNAWIGAPMGRAGAQDASVANMTVRGFFVGAPGTVRPDKLQ